MNLDDLLARLAASEGGDLWLSADTPPRIATLLRVEPLEASASSADEVHHLVEGMLDAKRRMQLSERGAASAAYVSAQHGRFRVRARRSLSGTTAELRAIPAKAPDAEFLGFRRAEHVPMLGNGHRLQLKGLVLVAGPRRSGLSSVVWFLLEQIAAEHAVHVATVEAPIELVHESQSCLFTQREIGTHVDSQAAALQDALESGADVVSSGPLRDAGAVDAALRLCDAGALVIATVESPPSSLRVREQLLRLYPPERRQEVAACLVAHLRGVHCRTLLPAASGEGLVPAVEFLTERTRSRKLLELGTVEAYREAMYTSAAKAGNAGLNASLLLHHVNKRVKLVHLFSASTDPEEFQLMVDRAARGESRRPPKR